MRKEVKDPRLVGWGCVQGPLRWKEGEAGQTECRAGGCGPGTERGKCGLCGGTLSGDNKDPRVTSSSVLILSFLLALSASSATVMFLTNIHMVFKFHLFCRRILLFLLVVTYFFFLKRNLKKGKCFQNEWKKLTHVISMCMV